MAGQVAQRCSEPQPLVLPLIPYGVAYHHEDFAGNPRISAFKLLRRLEDGSSRLLWTWTRGGRTGLSATGWS